MLDIILNWDINHWDIFSTPLKPDSIRCSCSHFIASHTRPIKRKRFDDELGRGAGGGEAGLLPLPPAPEEQHRSRQPSLSLPESSMPPTPGTTLAPGPAQCPSPTYSTSSTTSPIWSGPTDPTLVNSCLALPDLRLKKAVRDKKKKGRGRHREGALKDLSRYYSSPSNAKYSHFYPYSYCPLGARV